MHKEPWFLNINLAGAVTEQTGAWPCGPLIHNPTISVEGNRISFTGFQPQRSGEPSCPEPCPPRRPSTSLAPQKAMRQNMPRSSPHPYLFFSMLRKQTSVPSGTCTCGFQSCHPLAAALSFRVWGVLFSASIPEWFQYRTIPEWFREMCTMLR